MYLKHFRERERERERERVCLMHLKENEKLQSFEIYERAQSVKAHIDK